MAKNSNTPVPLSKGRNSGKLLDDAASESKARKPASNKTTVVNGANYLQTEEHYRFDEMIDHTIYVTKIDVLASDQYGTGFKVWFKDMPDEQGIMTASTFGAGPCAQLVTLYEAMKKGGTIPPGTYVKLTIRQAGRSYRFE